MELVYAAVSDTYCFEEHRDKQTKRSRQQRDGEKDTDELR